MTTIPRETAWPGRSAVFSRLGPVTHALLRIGVALLYMQHGAQKLFGLFGGVGPTPGRPSRSVADGTRGGPGIFGGLLLLLGLFTRPVARCCSPRRCGGASSRSTSPRVAYPLQNSGEVPLLYMLVCSSSCWATAPGRRASTADGGVPDPEEAPDPVARVSRGRAAATWSLPNAVRRIPPTPGAAPRPSAAERDLRHRAPPPARPTGIPRRRRASATVRSLARPPGIVNRLVSRVRRA